MTVYLVILIQKLLLRSSKIPKVFRYSVPAMVRRYLDCVKVLNVSMDKHVGTFLEELCGQENFRAPNNCCGSLNDLFAKKDKHRIA